MLGAICGAAAAAARNGSAKFCTECGAEFR